MKTKTIPFDLETAKKIQVEEIEGKIKTSKLHNNVRLLCDDFKNAANPRFRIICAILRNSGEYILAYDEYGCTCNSDEGALVLEVPYNEPQFKPFDKVLVRCSAYDYTCWQAAFYSHYTKDNDKHHVTTSGAYYMDNEILPYEGNEHLVGTTDKPKED